jgi:hypothetical protein
MIEPRGTMAFRREQTFNAKEDHSKNVRIYTIAYLWYNEAMVSMLHFGQIYFFWLLELDDCTTCQDHMQA